MANRTQYFFAAIAVALAACGPGERLYDVVGVVEELRPEDNQIIIAHEDIPGLMPAMTMNFDLEDPRVIDGLSEGDAIRFELVFTGRAYLIRSVEPLGEAETQQRKERGELSRPADPVPDFALVDHRGVDFSSQGARGRILLIDFIYTHCPGPCPILTGIDVEIQKLVEDLGERVLFCAISLDPERDTPEALTRYAEARGATASNWHFLTGPPADVADIVKRFGVSSQPAEDGELEHMVARFLVDPSGRIEERYLGLTHTAEAIAADIRRLAEREGASAAPAPSSAQQVPVAVSEVEAFRMEEFRQDLEGFQEPRARPVEVLIAVRDERPSFANGSQRGIAGQGFEDRELSPRALHVEAAGHHQ
jgi:protein SCO1/2